MDINKNFQKVLKAVITKGEKVWDESRQVNRLQIPSYTIKHSAEDGFPLLSIKGVPFRHIVSELVWFLNGDNTLEFLHKYDNHIWDKDIANWNGVDAGKNYGVQWRNYAGKVDQIQILIDNMKENINSSRLIVDAWNPAEITETTLPPCHTGFQIVGCKGGFELHWSQRSVDVFLGLPFNIASYYLLGEFLERVTGRKFLGIQGDLKLVHLYDNAILEGILLMNTKVKAYNEPYSVFLEEIPENLMNINPETIQIGNYRPDKWVSVEMLAPIKT
jgi:thymidylate synthase